MEHVVAFLLALREPSPAAADAIIEAWVDSPAEVPALPAYLGPAIERYHLRHELWRWDHRPVWTPSMVQFEITWCRNNLVDYPPLEDAHRLPTEEEIAQADAMLCGADCWFCRLAGMASPWNEGSIAAQREEIAFRRNLLSTMRTARNASGNLIYRRRALDEVRTLVGPRAWTTGEWAINVP